MITSINVTSEVRDRLQKHLKDGEVMEDIIIKLLDLDDKYGSTEPVEFEIEFNNGIIKVFKVKNNMIEYFTPARKFSVTLSDWNLPDEFYDGWVSVVTNPKFIPILISLGDNILECGNFIIRQIS